MSSKRSKSAFFNKCVGLLLVQILGGRGRCPLINLYWYQKTRDIGKGNIDLYSTSSRTPLTHSDMDHTVLPADNTISAFTRKHSPGGATTHKCIANAWVQLTTHLSIPRGWMAEMAMLADIQWTVYPEEVTRQLHVMAHVRESSPVIDQRSNHCAAPECGVTTLSYCTKHACDGQTDRQKSDPQYAFICIAGIQMRLDMVLITSHSCISWLCELVCIDSYELHRQWLQWSLGSHLWLYVGSSIVEL